MTPLWALVICVVIARCELPEGMHLANVVRVDTVYHPMRTPATRALDSLDSIFLEQSKNDLKKMKKLKGKK